jgi:FG-GAP repeat protein
MGGTNGAVIQSATTVSTNNPWHLVAVADFNGDGHPDLVWQNPSTGAAQVWYMTGGSGSTLLTAANFTTSNSWRIVAASNFTGYVSGGYTSHAYLVWEDPVAGGAQFWYEGCTNCTSSSAAPVYLGAAAVSGNNSWRIVATGL